MHYMKVKTKYYQLLKSGQKTIELRLYDEKRQKIKIGDKIEFSDLSDSSNVFVAQVVQLHRANSFVELCQKISPLQAGFSNVDEVLKVLEEFYTPSAQKEYGVLGIEIIRL